ncbi:MAG: ParB/RepB/Spo0J family partition protein [Oscillospiraceae bacterium]|nr:ParB/RepB/Spo0J family partition protein [Oscillospiraceae bacterium]MBQ8378371.1 ParB/RepB/Spo0J family partition protein [Oscillospiraceae bacterium]
MAKKKLGMGMDFLFNDNSVEEEAKGNVMLRISTVEPNKNQPRTHFDENAIVTLADSVRQHGVLQPILVRPLSNGNYQIVAGERRWRAARMAGLSEIPAVIKELSEKETAQIALIENLQREDLNPLEEALGYQGLMNDFEMTQAEVAQVVGKSRSTVTNSLRLLDLSDEVKEMLKNGELSTGHCKAILGIEDGEKQLEIAKEVVAKKLSVRQTEQLVSKVKEVLEGKVKVKAADEDFFKKPAYYSEVEISLKQTLGQKVSVSKNKDGSATVKISFKNDEALSEFVKRFGED